MSNNYPKMLEAARQYRDKRLCPDCEKLQKEVERLRKLVASAQPSNDDRVAEPKLANAG